jgi:hypothetical protein
MTGPSQMLSLQISRDDFVDAALLSSRITRPALIRHIIVALICAAMLFYAGGVTWGIAALILIPILMLLLREGVHLLYVPCRARRDYATYRRLKHNGQVGLEPEGLRFIDDDSNLLLRWEDFLKWRQSPKTTIMYMSPRIYIQLPERLASAGFDMQAVRDNLLMIIGKPF